MVHDIIYPLIWRIMFPSHLVHHSLSSPCRLSPQLYHFVVWVLWFRLASIWSSQIFIRCFPVVIFFRVSLILILGWYFFASTNPPLSNPRGVQYLPQHERIPPFILHSVGGWRVIQSMISDEKTFVPKWETIWLHLSYNLGCWFK